MSVAENQEKDWLLSITLRGVQQAWVGGVRLQHHAKRALIAHWLTEERAAVSKRAQEWARDRERTPQGGWAKMHSSEQEQAALNTVLNQLQEASQRAAQAHTVGDAWGWCSSAVWGQTHAMEQAILRLGKGAGQLHAQTFGRVTEKPSGLIELPVWGKAPGVRDEESARTVVRAALSVVAQVLDRAGNEAKRDTHWLLHAAALPNSLGALEVLASLEREALRRAVIKGPRRTATPPGSLCEGKAAVSAHLEPADTAPARSSGDLVCTQTGSGAMPLPSMVERKAKRL